MPKIQDYTEQTSAAGPERQTAANIEDTGNVGTAMRNAGSEVEAAGVFLDRRMGQADVANQSAALSNAHLDLGNELTDKVQNATPNEINGKNEDGSQGQTLSEKFSDRVDEAFNDLPQPTTRAGREFAQRQKAAIKQHLVNSMNRSQAMLVGENAVSTARTTVNTDANILEQDPSAFDMLVQKHSDYSQTAVPAAKVPELVRWGNEQLAEGAARGYIKADPSAGKKMLEAGTWDSYLTRPQKDQLSNFADSSMRAKIVDESRQEKLQNDAHKQLVEATQADMLQKIYNGNGISAKDAVNNPAFKGDPHAMEYMIAAIDKHQKDKLKTDPAVLMNLMDRIHSSPTNPDGTPNTQHISDASQLMPYVAGGGISIAVHKQLAQEISKTPDGQMDTAMTKQALNVAKSALTKTNPLLGEKDPQGDQQYALFLKDFMETRDKLKSAGKSAATMYDPRSPDYIGNIYQKYQQTPQQIMQNQADAYKAAFAAKAPAPLVVEVNGQRFNYKGTAEQAAKKGYKVVK